MNEHKSREELKKIANIITTKIIKNKSDDIFLSVVRYFKDEKGIEITKKVLNDSMVIFTDILLNLDRLDIKQEYLEKSNKYNVRIVKVL